MRYTSLFTVLLACIALLIIPVMSASSRGMLRGRQSPQGGKLETQEEAGNTVFVLPIGRTNNPFDPLNRTPGTKFPGMLLLLMVMCSV